MIVYFLVMNSRRRSRSRRKFRMSDLIAYFPFTIFISRSHVILIPPSSEIAMADPIYAPCNWYSLHCMALNHKTACPLTQPPTHTPASPLSISPFKPASSPSTYVVHILFRTDTSTLHDKFLFAQLHTIEALNCLGKKK